MTAFSDTLKFSATSALACGVPERVYGHPLSEQLSGVVISQNTVPQGNNDYWPINDEYVYQDFYLPSDYARGDKVPPLTGLSVFVCVDEGYTHTAALDWKVDYYQFGVGWTSLIHGTTLGAQADSANVAFSEGVWFDIFFAPQNIDSVWRSRFRFAVRGRSASQDIKDQEVEYDGLAVALGGQRITVVPTISPSPLREGNTYPFDYNGVPSMLWVEPGSGKVYYSKQQGVNSVWYSAPNPLAEKGRLKAYQRDGVTPILKGANEVSLLFRVYGATADSGRDFLGNNYRSAIVQNDPRNVDGLDSETKDRFWLSRPNPSKFAVESLYFDVRDVDKAVVIDRMLLDPLTPGMFANVYYSNDSAPGTDDKTWDNLMWERVPKVFGCHRREVHHFPRPITAKYIKVEFSHLQARYYAPGNFQKPITYKKYPKWVEDYFLAVYADLVDGASSFLSPQVRVVYDALDLAFNPYRDDLDQRPDDPEVTESSASESLVGNEVGSPPTADVADTQTLERIRLQLRPWLEQPSFRGVRGDILADFATNTDGDYSTEQIIRPAADTSLATGDERSVVEKNHPVMFFYLTCRHRYKVVTARFEDDRGYFAGIREIGFTREHYASRSDGDLYIESVGDNLNVESNDFESVNGTWVTYVTDRDSST